MCFSLTRIGQYTSSLFRAAVIHFIYIYSRICSGNTVAEDEEKMTAVVRKSGVEQIIKWNTIFAGIMIWVKIMMA